VRCHDRLSLFGSTAVDDGRLDLVLDLTGTRASRLEFFDDVQALLISNLAEDDVLAIQPGGNDGGDEELRAVGVGTSIGHGQHAGLGVSFLKVLIRKLLAVDRLATGAITTGEVATLQHELWDDSVEGRALVAEALLASAESTEVLGSLGNYIVVEDEVDPTLVRRGRSLASAFGFRALLVEGRIGPLDIEESSHAHFRI